MIDRRVHFALMALIALLVTGTLGYVWLERWSYLDAFYMTVITLSTVGFGELRPLSDAGRLFTSVLILLGVGTLAWALTSGIEALLERRLFYWRRIQMEIKRMHDHVIVCGFGRMGASVCDQLTRRGVPLVVVEQDPNRAEELGRRGILCVQSDATEDSTLVRAGIDRAKALATVLPNDSDNLFITLSARSRVADLTIVARASAEKNENKMRIAGATRVLNPYRNGGRLLARQLLHPTVTDFMDVITTEQESDLHLEEVQLRSGSSLAGVHLSNTPLRREMNVIVVGVRRGEEGMIFNPPGDLAPQVGDILVVLGGGESLQRLERLAAAAE